MRRAQLIEELEALDEQIEAIKARWRAAAKPGRDTSRPAGRETPSSPEPEGKLTPAEKRVVAVVDSRSETRAKDLVEALEISPALANQRLSELSNRGFIQRVGHGVYQPKR